MSEKQLDRSLEKLKQLVEEFNRENNYNVQKLENGYVIDIPLEYESLGEEEEEEKRAQFVYVTANRESYERDDVIQVFTVCAPENERFYKSALLLNMNLPFGAIAISEVEGKNHFVIVDTYLVSEVTAAELEKSILSLAKAGDQMEKVMISQDVS